MGERRRITPAETELPSERPAESTGRGSKPFRMDDSLSDYPPVAHLVGLDQAALAALARKRKASWHQRLPMWTFFVAGFASVLALGASGVILVKLLS